MIHLATNYSYTELSTLNIPDCSSPAFTPMNGIFVKSLDPGLYSDIFQSWQRLMSTHENFNASNSSILIESFGRRAIEKVPTLVTAFPNRKEASLQVGINIRCTEEVLAPRARDYAYHTRQKLQNRSGYPKLHVYQNYASDDESLEAIYGWNPQRLSTLREVKQKFDPLNRFFGYHPFI